MSYSWQGSSIESDDDREIHPFCGRAVEDCRCKEDDENEGIEVGEILEDEEIL